MRLTVILAKLHRIDPELFRNVNGITWENGQAILISNDRDKMAASNPSAQIMEIPESDYVVDVGHDTEAMKRLVKRVMQRLGCPPGLTNEVALILDPVRPGNRHEYLE